MVSLVSRWWAACEDGLSFRPMAAMFLWYVAGSIFAYWYYGYEAITRQSNEGILVSFFVLLYAYQALTALACLVWWLADRRAQKAELRQPPPPELLRVLYLRRWTRTGKTLTHAFSPRAMRLAKYMRHSRYYHIVVIQVMSAVAVVNGVVGTFFLAYAHQWEAFAICVALQCYPALVLLPLLCFCLWQVMYHPRAQLPNTSPNV